MGISSAGIGSGLDVNSLITQLMQLERQPLNSLTTKKQTVNSQLSAYGQIKSALDAFKSAVSSLKLDTNFTASKATSSNTSLLTATTDNTTAVEGTYDIVVSSLAQAGIKASLGQSTSSTAIGTANFANGTGPSTLTISTGGKSFDVSVSATDTLETVRDKINAAVISGDTASQGLVNASIVNTGTYDPAKPSTTGYQLVISSTQTGTANAATTTTSDATLGAYFGFRDSQTATDASFTINGLGVTRSTNTVSDVVTGVTLNLAGADATKHTSLSVARDTDAITGKINAFISAYNKLSSTINSLHQKDGTLEADNSATAVISQLQATFNQSANIAGNSYSWLAQVGVSFQKDGTLSLDSATFTAALKSNYKNVVSLFTDSDQGFASRLYNSTQSMLNSNGLIDSRISGLNARIKSLDDNIDKQNLRLTNVETRLRTQYANLDSLLGTMKNTSSYLSSQLR